jgi:hypothetical protein
MGQVPRRFWISVIAGAAAGLLLLVTLLWHDWIEVVFGVDPDGGSGALEWLVVVLSGATAVSCSVVARLDWRAAQEARTSV